MSMLTPADVLSTTSSAPAVASPAVPDGPRLPAAAASAVDRIGAVAARDDVVAVPAVDRVRAAAAAVEPLAVAVDRVAPRTDRGAEVGEHEPAREDRAVAEENV